MRTPEALANPWPPGLELRFTESVAQLHFASAAVQEIYLAIVGKEPAQHKSAYYSQHWVTTLGPVWNTFIEQLRHLALTESNPRPTIPDLAELCGVSIQTVRRCIEFWREPQWMSAPRSQWPPKEYSRWLGVRSYVPSICSSGSNTPYHFRVLLGDALHPKHQPEFVRLLQTLQPQLALDAPLTSVCPTILVGQEAPSSATTDQIGEASPDGTSTCPIKVEGQNPPRSNSTLHTGRSDGTAKLSPKPKPKHKQLSSAAFESETDFPYPPEEQAEQLLREKGIQPNSIQELLCLANGRYWAVRWCIWIDFREAKRPAGLLYRILKSAILGNEEDRRPPTAFIRYIEEQVRDRKSRERSASVLRSPNLTLSNDVLHFEPVPELWDTITKALSQHEHHHWLMDGSLYRRADGVLFVVDARGGLQVRLREALQESARELLGAPLRICRRLHEATDTEFGGSATDP